MSCAERIARLTAQDIADLERAAPPGPYATMGELIKAAQRELCLPDDGDPGRMTMACARHPVDELPEPARTLLLVALGETGNGEEGRNNGGPHVAKYKGDLGNDEVDLGSWCSSFAGWVIDAAYALLGSPSPVKRTGWARSLASRCARAGTRITDPRDVLPGDIVLIERGDAGGTSHIFIARTPGPNLVGWEGNVGRYPAKVRGIWRKLRKPGGEPKSGDFLWAARLPAPRHRLVS